MKKRGKLASLLLALVMVLSMAMNVSAANNPHTITINNDIAGHVYEAYQVFAGDYYQDEAKKETLSDVTWGSGVDSAALLEELKKDSAYSACTTAESVVDVLGKFENDSAELDKFAEIVGKHLTTIAGKSTAEKTPYTVNVTGDGYYFVKDTKVAATDDAYTKYILQVVGDVEINAKSEVPILIKKIDENGTKVDANNGSVGDVVNYVLTSKVPEMDGYEKYFFIAHDTLSKGLTLNYNADDMVGFEIKVGDKILENGKDYTIAVDGQTFKVVFDNFIQYKSVAGAEITISYSATINKNAVIGNVGNPNYAYLEYSNNPNVVPGGENEPVEGDVTGITPKDYVITYITGIKIFKQDEEGNKLTGAEFELAGESTNMVHVVGKAFEEDAEGTYYKLTDGTYTETEPTDETVDKYASTEVKYALVDVDKWIETSKDVKANGYVDNEGYLVFDGLGEGTYTITEIKAPDGYNKLTDSIIVEITWVAPEKVSDGTEKAGWTYKYTIGDKEYVPDKDALELDRVGIGVVNNKGATLPETGGMGTTIFYVLGTILVIGAAVLMITKKRMSSVR